MDGVGVTFWSAARIYGKQRQRGFVKPHHPNAPCKADRFGTRLAGALADYFFMVLSSRFAA